MARAPLWRCGECGGGFANRHQSHACGRWTLAHHFDGTPPAIRALREEYLVGDRRNLRSSREWTPRG